LIEPTANVVPIPPAVQNVPFRGVVLGRAGTTSGPEITVFDPKFGFLEIRNRFSEIPKWEIQASKTGNVRFIPSTA
jgi:hypothetical protein